MQVRRRALIAMALLMVIASTGVSFGEDLKAAPDFTADGLKGGKVKLADYKGKVLILDFWASWCPDCRAELPQMRELYAKVKERTDVALLSLSVDKTFEKLESFVEKNDMPWQHGYLGEWSKTGVLKGYGVEGIPAIFIVTPDGKLLFEKPMSAVEILNAIAMKPGFLNCGIEGGK